MYWMMITSSGCSAKEFEKEDGIYLSWVFWENPTEENVHKQSSKGNKTLRFLSSVQSEKYSK